MRARTYSWMLSAPVLAAPLVPSRAGAQAPPATQQQPLPRGKGQEPARVQVAVVNVVDPVRDKSRRIVSNLEQKDFRIFEDNQEQKLAYFTRETALPITLGLLIDTSGSETNRLPAEQDAASQFLTRVMRKGDEAMVVSFGMDIDLLADFTDDHNLLERAIRRARINAPTEGLINPPPFPPPPRQPRGTAFYDAIYVACREKLSSEAGRKALAIITDAVDEGSKVKLEESIEAAQRSDTVIHILLVSEMGYNNPGVAKKITDETGGRMIQGRSEKKLQEAFDQISEGLRTQEQLGYYPTNTASDGTFRNIKIETYPNDLRVLPRRGYYAPKS